MTETNTTETPIRAGMRVEYVVNGITVRKATTSRNWADIARVINMRCGGSYRLKI